MPFLTFTPGTDLDALRAGIAAVKAQLSVALGQGLLEGGNVIAGKLATATPVGKGAQGTPLPGDAPGRLNSSFSAVSTGALSAAVQTSQPLKLTIVVEGRKAVRPVTKRALYWDGLPHPVMVARATEPNDFVGPVLASAGEVADVVFAPVEALFQGL